MTKRSAMMDRALREAIDAMASPEVRDSLILQALEGAAESAIPEGGARLQRFVNEFLGPTLRERLGYDAADAILTSLAPIVQMATEEISQVRPRSTRPQNTAQATAAHRSSKPTPKAVSAPSRARTTPAPATRTPVPGRSPRPARTPPPAARTPPPSSRREEPAEEEWPEVTVESRPRPASSSNQVPAALKDPEERAGRPTLPAPDRGLPVVLLATSDPQQVEALDALLRGHAWLAGVHDPIGLLDALQAHAERQPVLIVDCRRPCVRATTVAAMAPELPEGTTVVLWGADDGTEAELEDVEPSARDWIRCTAEATAQDLVSLCSMLIR
jgi:hypothetical protein